MLDNGDLDAGPEWLATAQARIAAERQHAIAELDALSAEVDAARLMVTLLAKMAFVVKDEWHEVMHSTLAVQVELLVFELFPRFGRSTSTTISAEQVQRGLEAVERLFNALQQSKSLTSARVGAAEPLDGGIDGLDSLLTRLRIEAEIVRGSAYPEQTRLEIEEAQGHFEDEFARFAGIGPRRAATITDAIIRALEVAFNGLRADTQADLDAAEAAWVAIWRRRHQRLSADERRFLATVPTAAAARNTRWLELLAAGAPGHLPVARERVSIDPPPTVQEWEALCRLIGCDRAARAGMAAPIEMRARPLYIFPDGRVFLYDISNALDQLWTAFEQEARRADPRWADGPYAQHKGAWLEDRTSQCLRRIFPASTIYRHLSYPDPDTPAHRAEIDIVVHWPPFVLLVEAKARQFRLAGQLGDTQRLKSDLRDNVQDAFWQADRAARYIQQAEEAQFTEIDSGRVLVIRREDLRRTYLTTISQHALAGIATRLAATRPLGLFKAEQYPWALSIADLDLITRFCPGPDVLLHYVERRLGVQAGEIALIGDELDFFGAYLDTRLQPERLWGREVQQFDMVSLSGYQEPFDAVMAHARGQLSEAPPIQLAVPDEIAAILGALRREAIAPDDRWIAFSLLDLPDRALGMVAHLLRMLRTQPVSPGAFRSGVYAEDDWVVVIVMTADRTPDELFQATGSRTALEQYRRKATRGVGLGIVAGDATAPYESVFWGYRPWEQDEQMEELLRSQPVPAYVPGTRLPGRNEPCPCGSGRKFKHCCSHNIERPQPPPTGHGQRRSIRPPLAEDGRT